MANPSNDVCTPAAGGENSDTLASKAINGGLWAFALNYTNRGFGILRTIILARLLAPDDFGLLGMALLTTATLETLTQTGFQGAIIQRQVNISSYLNTAWTCSALRGMILFALLYVLAPQVASFFEDPRVVPVVRVIGIAILLSGFSNIGIVLFKKELNFRKQYTYDTVSNLIDVILSIAMAVWLRNVWALVIGGLAGHVMRLILSYGLHPWRPTISLDLMKFKNMFAFGKWMLVTGILHLLITKGDDILVGKWFGVASLGIYQIAYLLSNVTTTDLAHTISNISFPAYSKIQADPPSVVKAYLKVLRGVAFISVLVTFCLCGFSSELVVWLLGRQWMSMVPVLEVLAIAGLARSIQSTAVPVFLAMNRPRFHTEISILRAVVLFGLIYPFAMVWGMVGIAYAALASSAVSVVAASLRIPALINLRVSQFYVSILVPVLTAAISLIAILLVKSTGIESGTWQRLVLLAFGVSLYVGLSIAFDGLLKFGMRETLRELWQHIDLGGSNLPSKTGKTR